MAGSAADVRPALLASRDIHVARPYAVCPAWRASDGEGQKQNPKLESNIFRQQAGSHSSVACFVGAGLPANAFDLDLWPLEARLGWRFGTGMRGMDASQGEER